MDGQEDLFGVVEQYDRDTDPRRPHRILITGSRDFPSQEFVFQVLDHLLVDSSHQPFTGDLGMKYLHTVVVHGGARGADSMAEAWVQSRVRMRDLSLEQVLGSEVHLADWKSHGKGAGHRRNGEMVLAGADLCVAFPLPDGGESRGTRNCMDQASRAGIRVLDATSEHWETFSATGRL